MNSENNKMLCVSAGDLSVGNFPEGNFSHRLINAEEMGVLVQNAVKNHSGFLGYFDFPAVPSKRKTKDFREFVEALSSAIRQEIELKWFLHETEPGDPDTGYFPNIIELLSAAENSQLVVVEYFFTMPEGIKPDFKKFKISADTLKFHLFEKI